MLRTCACWSAAVLITAGAVWAKEFSLEFKTLKANEIMAFPGGYGSFGRLLTTKPASLKQEPKAVSKAPLYGLLAEAPGKAGILFRLDESKGDGKGYDQLIIDLNQNGDLRDDTAMPDSRAQQTQGAPQARASASRFGPFKAPVRGLSSQWQPQYLAEANLSNPRFRESGNADRSYIGQLRLKAGWYLETEVEMDGTRQRLALMDGNADLSVGDPWKPDSNGRAPRADTLLRDVNGNGQFERDPFDLEVESWAELLYVGRTPYKAALGPEGKCLQLEPCAEPLAEFSVGPRADQVRRLVLAWESAPGQWQLIHPTVADRKAVVPPGNYRLQSCTLLGKEGRDQVMALGATRSLRQTLKAEVGRAIELKCGSALEVRVTANKSKATAGKTDLNLNMLLVGQGGEVYSTYGTGRDFYDQPPKPTFTVTDQGGKQLGSGNLEFG